VGGSGSAEEVVGVAYLRLNVPQAMVAKSEKLKIVRRSFED
jgi:hypothetical protein